MPNVVDPFPRPKPGIDDRLTSDKLRSKDREIGEHMKDPRVRAHMAQCHERYLHLRKRYKRWRPRYRINEQEQEASHFGHLTQAAAPAGVDAVNAGEAEKIDVEEGRVVGAVEGRERPERRAMGEIRERCCSEVQGGGAVVVDGERTLVEGGLKAATPNGEIVARTEDGEPQSDNPFDDLADCATEDSGTASEEDKPEDPFKNPRHPTIGNEEAVCGHQESRKSSADASVSPASSTVSSQIGPLAVSPNLGEPFTDSSTPPSDDPGSTTSSLRWWSTKCGEKLVKKYRDDSKRIWERKERIARFFYPAELRAEEANMDPKPKGVGRRFLWGRFTEERVEGMRRLGYVRLSGEEEE